MTRNLRFLVFSFYLGAWMVLTPYVMQSRGPQNFLLVSMWLSFAILALVTMPEIKSRFRLSEIMVVFFSTSLSLCLMRLLGAW